MLIKIYSPSHSLFQPVQHMVLCFVLPQPQEPDQCLNNIPTYENKENSQPATIPPGLSQDSR